MTRTAERLVVLEPATYLPPMKVNLYGDRAVPVPFPVFLVEHPDGLVLFDTGLDPDHAGDPAGAYGEVADRIRIDFRDDHLIEPQLAAHGYSPSHIGTVVASHLHFDHAGALKRFVHARTYVGDGELDWARNPERFAATWYREEDFADRHGIDWHVLPTDYDLFGDGSVVVLLLPGHSPGSLGLLVRLPQQTVILTGDVVHNRLDLDNEMHYLGDMDSVAARRSLRKLKWLADTHGADIWINHDVDDWARHGGAGIKT
jgi:N-acyl homoserine lactone hydrolase